jgi:uncharacterized protein (TIGR00369 family)
MPQHCFEESMSTPHPFTVEVARERGEGRLPGLMGVEATAIEEGRIAARLRILPHHLAPNGFLHAAAVISLADTACGYGALRSLPAGGTGFTTIELKANFLGTAREGAIACEARLVHGGGTTQVWDATVVDERTAKTIALFRCTQLVLYPR